MGKMYCTECGTQIDDTATFCSKCGAKVDDSSNNSKTSNSSNKGNSASSISTIFKEPKIIILCVVALLLLVGIFAQMGGGSNDANNADVENNVGVENNISVENNGGNTASNIVNNDLVDVTDVIYEINDVYGSNQDGYVSAVAFKIVPKETISGINSFKVNNFKVTYENGQTDDFGTLTFKNKNAYIQNKEYTLHHKYSVNQNVYGQKVHVSGDIVVDTLYEQNKVIGRLDYDTTAKSWSAKYA